MEKPHDQNAIVLVGNTSVVRYSNALIRRGLEEVSRRTIVDAEVENGHILIVDDERTLVEVIQSGLLREGVGNVYVSDDSEEALGMLERFGEKILVVSLGLIMPKVDGFEFMKRLAKRHQHMVGIVMLTGGGFTPENAIRFKELGTENIIALDFVAKPPDWGHYYSRIKRAVAFVRTKRQEARSVLMISGNEMGRFLGEYYCRLIRSFGYKVFMVPATFGLERMSAELERGAYSILIVTNDDKNTLVNEFVSAARAQLPFLPILVLTTYADLKQAIFSKKAGVDDCISIPVELNQKIIDAKANGQELEIDFLSSNDVASIRDTLVHIIQEKRNGQVLR